MDAPPTDRELAFDLRGVRQGYPKLLGLARTQVLHGIDLCLARGASLGLVGPNGSGKSTLLRLLAGLEKTSGGTIAVLGDDPRDWRVQRRVAFLPEDSPYPREMRADQLLDLLAWSAGLPRGVRRERCARALDEVGLAQVAHHRFARFSRGMLRRLGLAATFLADPDVVLLDEPTAGLDAQGFEVLDRLIRRAKEQRGASVVIASHILSDVVAHGDRLAVLIGGRVVFEGAPRDLVSDARRVGLELEGLTETALAEIEREVERRGGRVLGRLPSQAALFDLYRRSVDPSR